MGRGTLCADKTPPSEASLLFDPAVGGGFHQGSEVLTKGRPPNLGLLGSWSMVDDGFCMEPKEPIPITGVERLKHSIRPRRGCPARSLRLPPTSATSDRTQTSPPERHVGPG